MMGITMMMPIKRNLVENLNLLMKATPGEKSFFIGASS
jgi:hypothetical protein